jgi:hypothetical protein
MADGKGKVIRLWPWPEQGGAYFQLEDSETRFLVKDEGGTGAMLYATVLMAFIHGHRIAVSAADDSKQTVHYIECPPRGG